VASLKLEREQLEPEQLALRQLGPAQLAASALESVVARLDAAVLRVAVELG
jgi:hypothetical protein